MSRAFLHDLLTSIGQRSRELVHARPFSLAEETDVAELAEALLSQRGEASGMALAELLFERYERMTSAQKLDFFKLFTERFGPERQRLTAAVAEYAARPTDQSAMDLHDAAEPRRQELIRRLNRAAGGTPALVAMREDLLALLPRNAELAVVDHDFHHLFSSWFNRGFLVLRRIDWDTPASVLEKVIQHEAVHEIRNWDDLRRRIEPPDRRCYAFFHPALANEPLIFVEVALEPSIPRAVAPLLAQARHTVRSGDMRAAVFYSISNCQRGLRGVSFGSFLIKQVVQELVHDLPQLKTFVTLSPVPGFTRWLDALCRDGSDRERDVARWATDLLTRPNWHRHESIRARLKEKLLPMAATYFLHARQETGMPVDAVARFHLGNGARLEHINWLGDQSPAGIERSAGLMVNYLYSLTDIEKNHEAFANRGRIAATHEIRKLAKKWRQEYSAATGK